MINQHELRSVSTRVSETTRYLCAAAYLDKRFADEVILHVLEEEHRAVAPSYGVDLVPVICHCLAARRRRLLRDSVLTGLVLVVLLLVIVLGPVALLVLLLGWGVVFVAFCLDRQMLATNLLRDRFDPAAAPAPTSQRDARLISELEHNMQSNVTVYSGFSPFVGSGIEDEGWSFTTNTQKGKETLDGVAEPIPFEVDELYDFVSTDLRGLDIAGLHVESRLFVNGRDIRANPGSCLTNSPDHLQWSTMRTYSTSFARPRSRSVTISWCRSWHGTASLWCQSFCGLLKSGPHCSPRRHTFCFPRCGRSTTRSMTCHQFPTQER
jgi:hypothetical protein